MPRRGRSAGSAIAPAHETIDAPRKGVIASSEDERGFLMARPSRSQDAPCSQRRMLRLLRRRADSCYPAVVRVFQVCLSGVLLAACTGDSSPSSATPPVPTPSAMPLIDVRPITVTFGGRPIARLLADGRTESVGKNPPGGAMSPGPTLHADGTIQFTKGGLTARISRGGEIYVSNPGPKEELFARIAGDHLGIGDEKNGVHVHGDMIAFDNGRDDVGKIEGAVDAGMRRTALVMTAAFFIDSAITP